MYSRLLDIGLLSPRNLLLDRLVPRPIAELKRLLGVKLKIVVAVSLEQVFEFFRRDWIDQIVHHGDRPRVLPDQTPYGHERLTTVTPVPGDQPGIGI